MNSPEFETDRVALVQAVKEEGRARESLSRTMAWDHVSRALAATVLLRAKQKRVKLQEEFAAKHCSPAEPPKPEIRKKG